MRTYRGASQVSVPPFIRGYNAQLESYQLNDLTHRPTTPRLGGQGVWSGGDYRQRPPPPFVHSTFICVYIRKNEKHKRVFLYNLVPWC